MRVIVATRIYRPEPSAASLLLGAVVDELTSRGNEVEVLTVTPPRGLRAEPRGERVRTFPVLRDKSGYVRGYLQYLSFDVPLFFRLLFARRADVVFMEPPPTTGVVVRIVCAIRRMPYVYDTADIWSDAAGHATSSGLVVRAVRAFERFALRGARALVTISQGVVDRVRELGVDTPIEITGYGADTETFHHDAAVPPEKLFLYAGTHTELHGAHILIEAFARFSETHPGYRLAFVGNGTGQPEMIGRAEALGIAEAVSFESPVPPDELNRRLAAAVASLATLKPGGGYEYAFTTKAYSSLAAGCPVIFAGPGPTREFLTEAARHCAAGAAVEYDADEIAAAMRDLATEARKPGERAAVSKWVAQEHSMAAMARRVARVIETVASEGRAR